MTAGFSGGTLNRPALQQLMSDIRAGRIDRVVIYKIDRLTRSLADFAKLVEIFDAHGVSFVSITQQFNTTTSMGRLTLNILLSFAQFEREVTGERIRDKIAASKRRGMWMGGPLPLGYDLRDRKLSINVAEAETVRHIFRSYLELGSVRLLDQRLRQEGIRSKTHRTGGESPRGGKPIVRGALYLILQNRLYRGEVSHKGTIYPGEHAAIIDAELWDAVQAKLAAQRTNSSDGPRDKMPSLLTGLIYDDAGDRLIPSHAVKGGKRYRYYVSARLTTGSRADAPDGLRVPAADIETGVLKRVRSFLTDRGSLFDMLRPLEPDITRLQPMMGRAVEIAGTLDTAARSDLTTLLQTMIARVEVRSDQIGITIQPAGLLRLLRSGEMATGATRSGEATGISDPVVLLTVPLNRRRIGRDTRLLIDRPETAHADPALVRLLVRAHDLKAKLMQSGNPSPAEIAASEGIGRTYLTRMARLAFLSPEITTTILEGHQPTHLTAARLSRLVALPLDWVEQRRMLAMGLTEVRQ
jgi:site-specific DNA recombinase